MNRLLKPACVSLLQTRYKWPFEICHNGRTVVLFLHSPASWH